MSGVVNNNIDKASLTIGKKKQTSTAVSSFEVIEESASSKKKKSASQGRTSTKNDALYGKGKLTKRLISEGLLTPEMLEALRKEWQNDDK